MQETWVQSLGLEDPLERRIATHSSLLAWKIPWTEELCRLYSPWGCKESDTTEQLTLSLFTFMKKAVQFMLSCFSHVLWNCFRISFGVGWLGFPVNPWVWLLLALGLLLKEGTK